ncbi:MAG TPA: hypothetical protein VFK18_03035 [Luteimonas sp.]|nr:hypothetical protein [Luteimonas sp.]
MGDNMAQSMERRHSGLGIASFITSLVAGLLTFILIAAAAMMVASSQGTFDETSPEAVGLGLGIMALLLVELVAVGLGIAGMLQKERKKLFAILGLVLSGLAILIVLALMVIGNAA